MRRPTGVALILMLVLGFAACGATAARAQVGDDGPVPTAADVPGYHAAGTSATIGRAAFGAPLPRTLKTRPTAGAGFRGPGRTLSFGVVTARSAGSARTALKALGHGRQAVSLAGGTAARVRVRTHGHRSDVSVVFAVGEQLGAVRLRVTPASTGARAAAIAQAGTLVSRLVQFASTTPFDRTIESIRPDGSIAPALALRAFAQLYGPLPGVPGVSAQSEPQQSGTLAIELVEQDWDQFSAAQQAAISAALGTTRPGKAATPSARAAVQSLTFDAALTTTAYHDDVFYRAHIPGIPTIAIQVYRASEDLPAAADADAQGVDAHNNFTPSHPPDCLVRISPGLFRDTPAYQAYVLAHEVFHCEEFALEANWTKGPKWIEEGMAEWAAFGPVPAADRDPDSTVWMREYYRTPFRGLFARTYDAVGFWGIVDQQSGAGSLWKKVPKILAQLSAPSAVFVAGGLAEPFLDREASSVWRLPAAGDPWVQSDPAALATNEAPNAYLTVDADTQIDSAPYGLGEAEVIPDPDKPVIEVLPLEGHTRLGTPSEDFGRVELPKYFCDGECSCPPGSTGELPAHENLTGPLLVALDDGDGRGRVQVLFKPLDQYCKSQPSVGIQIRTADDKIAARFKTGVCSVAGGAFHATATDGAWSLDVRIPSFGGYSKRYDLFHGSKPVFTVKGPGGPYSNRYPSPHMTVGAGGIAFYPKGAQMLLGYEYAWNGQGSTAILTLGKMTCKPAKK